MIVWLPRGRYRFFKHMMAVVCCLAVLTACSARKSEQYRQEADTLLQLGKVADATAAYRRSAEVNPDNAMARVGLGRCQAIEERYDEAIKEFRAAIAIDPQTQAAYQELVALLIKLGRADEALDEAKKFESVNEERGGLQHAYVLLRTGDTPGAVKRLETLSAKYPASVNIRLRLAQAHMAASDPVAAEEQLKKVLAADPHSVDARMALITAYQAQGKIGEIVSQFEKLAAENPEDTKLAIGLARSMLLAGRGDEAEAIARPLYEAQPESGWANYVLGECLLAKQDFEAAQPYLAKAKKALPEQPDVALALAKAMGTGAGAGAAGRTSKYAGTAKPASYDWRQLWQQGAIRQLLEHRKSYGGQDPEGLAETLMLAALFSEDITLTEELAKELPSDSMFVDFTDKLREIVQLKEKRLVAYLDYTKKWYKESDILAPAQTVLRDNASAYGLALLGSRSKAVLTLSESLKVAPGHGVTLLNLARVFNVARMPLQAARCVELVVAQAPNNLDAHALLYSIYRGADETGKARLAAERAYGLFADSPQAILNLAQSYMDVGSLGLAQRVLSNGLDGKPGDPLFSLAMARVQLHAGLAAEATDILQTLQVPQSLEQRKNATLAFCAARTGQWDDVRERCAKLDRPTMPINLRMLAAAAMIRGGQEEQATQLLAENYKEGATASRLVADLLVALGHIQPPEGTFDNILSKLLTADRDAWADYAYGLACFNFQDYGAALAVLDPLRLKAPASPSLVDLVMNCYARGTDPKARLDEAKTITKANPTMAEAWLGLARIAEILDDAPLQEQTLNSAMKAAPQRPDVWIRAGLFLEAQSALEEDEEARLAKLAEAIAAYRKLVELVPEGIAANNNLAYCLMTGNGDLNEALKYAEVARSKRPSDPAILHTLGAIQLGVGMLEESRRNLTIALELRPGDPTLLLDYGKLQIAEGKDVDGKRYVNLALHYSEQLGLDFPRQREAVRIVRGKE